MNILNKSKTIQELEKRISKSRFSIFLNIINYIIIFYILSTVEIKDYKLIYFSILFAFNTGYIISIILNYIKEDTGVINFTKEIIKTLKGE